MSSPNPPGSESSADREAPGLSLVGSIMTRHVITIAMDDTLRTVRSLFDLHRFHHLVVVDRGRAVGVVSDRDLLRHLSPFLGQGSERTLDLSTLDRKVHQAMSRRLISVKEHTRVEEAGQLMLQHTISCLPVLDEAGGCVGIVTSHDVMRWCLQGKCAIDLGRAA